MEAYPYARSSPPLRVSLELSLRRAKKADFTCNTIERTCESINKEMRIATAPSEPHNDGMRYGSQRSLRGPAMTDGAQPSALCGLCKIGIARKTVLPYNEGT